MPQQNRFQHQPYGTECPSGNVELLCPAPPPPIGSDDYQRCLAGIGTTYRRADVRAIYLLHGTFVGTDALGLIRGVARATPEVAESLYRLQKQMLDALAGDAGNFTSAFAAEFERALNPAGTGSAPLPVRLFHWSSENHHVGRADGAVRLIDELASRPELSGGRVLVWGHSHGGNVLALMTNLLANDPATNRRFFEAAKSYYRWPWWGTIDIQVWHRVRRMLEKDDHPLRHVALDLVTLGTPVRYGWDSGGLAHLLHFIYHRPAAGLPPYRAPFPPPIPDVLAAAGGDYVQQLGIAGTNTGHPFWAWRAWLADIRLGRLLQPGLRLRDTLARLRLGVRAHHEGTTLLVDYGPARGHLGQHVAGHAVYTRLVWLPFHAAEIARRFYCKLGSGLDF